MSTPASMPPHMRGVQTVPPVGPARGRRSARATAARPSHFRERLRVTIRGFGEILITLGLVLLLFCAYQLWWTDVTSNAATKSAEQSFASELQNTPVAPANAAIPGIGTLYSGQAFALIYIPRFGSTWVRPIIQGVDLTDLHKGVGHYPDSALPGQIGNFAVAGHRTTNGHPFRNIDQLQIGDQIFVETREAWYTYTVTQPRLVVKPSDTYVVAPVPVKGSTAAPTQAIMTMTSCHPPYSASERMVVHAKLTATRPRALGPPPGAPADAV